MSLQFQSSRPYVTVLIYIEDSLVGVIVIISMTNEERIDNEDESGWACDIDRIRLKECGGYLRKRDANGIHQNKPDYLPRRH